MKQSWMTLLACLALAACGESGAPQNLARGLDAEEEPPFEATIDAIQDNVFTPACTRCHSGNIPSGGLALDDVETSYASLVDVDARGEREFKRVATDDAGNSYLIHKLEGTQSAGSQMPRGEAPLDQATIDVIREWIDGGALPPGSEPPADEEEG